MERTVQHDISSSRLRIGCLAQQLPRKKYRAGELGSIDLTGGPNRAGWRDQKELALARLMLMTQHVSGTASAAALLLVVLFGTANNTRAQDLRPTAAGDQDTAAEVEIDKGPPIEIFQRMTYQGLSVEVPTVWQRVPMALQTAGPDALRELERRVRLSSADKNIRQMVLPDELVGMPAIVTRPRIAAPWQLRFTIDKPARVYAFINFDLTDDADVERESWSLYRREAKDAVALYYRDFLGGEQTARFHSDGFIGAGVRPVASLSAEERLIVVARLIEDRPVLEITSEHDKPVDATFDWQLVDPAGEALPIEGRGTVPLPPHRKQQVEVDLEGIRDGILYRFEAQVVAAGVRKTTSLPFGRFPVPATDPSVQDPLIPYGGYFKTTVSDDREFRDIYFRAMFHKLRQVKMNACVLDPRDNRRAVLDLAEEYGIKCVVRLAGKKGEVRLLPDDVVKHPAVLTTMIGDEPHLDELDAYRRAFEEVIARYPRYRPITCTIYDGWGLGGGSDPSIIFNHELADLPLTRFGRLYCFRRPGYGLLRPVEYKRWQDVTSIFSALEISSPEPWWLGPQFFGHDNTHPYWRVPTGAELNGVMHMALAHNCRGLLGWALHTHAAGRIQSVGWDGVTLAPATHEQLDALEKMGRHIAAVKDVLLARALPYLRVYYLQPYEIHAAGHWLTDGRMLLYLVNRDVEKPHAAQLKLFLGGGPTKRDKEMLPLMDEVVSVDDLVTGKPMQFEKLAPGPEEPNYLVISTDAIPPGGARMLVINGFGPGGRFPNAPELAIGPANSGH